MPISPDMIDRLDEIVERTACRLSIDDIGELAFGGLVAQPGLADFLDDVILAGIGLRKCAGLPLAVPAPPEIGFFLVVWAVEWLTDKRVTKGARGIDKVARRLEKIERRHGADDGIVPWPSGEEPPEWQAANREWTRIHDEIFIDCLRPHAPLMADLFAGDRDEFYRRREVGRVNLARLIGRDDVLEPIEDRLRDALKGA